MDAVRACGVDFTVRPPTVTQTAVTLTIVVGPGGVKSALIPQVATAVAAYVDALPVGGVCSVTRIAQAAYAVHPSITNVLGVTVNGGNADLAPGPTGVAKASAITVH